MRASTQDCLHFPVLSDIDPALIWFPSESQDIRAEVELPPPVGVCRESVGSMALVIMGDDVEALCLVKECSYRSGKGFWDQIYQETAEGWW